MNTKWVKSGKKHCTKIKFSMIDFFSKCDQIRNFLQIWSHLLKKSFMVNFIFCAVTSVKDDHKGFKDIINPYNCLLKNANFSIKTSNE